MDHFFPLPGLPTAAQLAIHFFAHIFSLHGFPLHIVSDRGVQFMFKFWRALCTLLQIKLDFSSAYQPQSNGQVERVNQILGVYRHHFVSSHQTDWADYRDYLLFFIVYSQHPHLPLTMAITSDVPAVNSQVRDFLRIWQDPF